MFLFLSTDLKTRYKAEFSDLVTRKRGEMERVMKANYQLRKIEESQSETEDSISSCLCELSDPEK